MNLTCVKMLHFIVAILSSQQLIQCRYSLGKGTGFKNFLIFHEVIPHAIASDL
jgi:hypothetical protein